MTPNNTSQEAPSTVIIVLFSAFLSSIAFIVASYLPIILNLPKKNDLYEIVVGIVSILFGIGFTTFVLKKIYRPITFGKIFISGWMTALFMAAFCSLFYVIAFHYQWIPLQEGESVKTIISVVLLKYNALGMMFSAIIAVIFKSK